MHDIRYDAINDEFLTTNPFAAAVLVFRGGADGQESPVRVIQGSKTQLRGPSRVEVDPVNDEIFVPNADSILVFRRDGNGDIDLNDFGDPLAPAPGTFLYCASGAAIPADPACDD